MPEPSSYQLERFKVMFDYLKHLTTLSTGSIILLATFLEKLFVQPRWKFLVVIALAGFMLSVIAAVIQHSIWVYSVLPRREHEGAETPTWEIVLGVGSLLITWLGFLIGIISLTAFAMKNLFV